MWYDFLIVCVLLFFTMRGAAKGVVWQLAHIAGIVLCFMFAGQISAIAGPYVHLDPPLNQWVTMVGAYLVFTFFCFAFARGLTGWIEKNKMTEFDRHLGGLLGLVKGVILALLLTFAVVTLSESARTALKSSHSGRLSAIILLRLQPLLPDKLHRKVADYIELLDHPGLPQQARDDSGEILPPPSAGSVLGPSAPLPQAPAQSPSPLWSQLQSVLNADAQRALAAALQHTADPAQRAQLEREALQLMQSLRTEDRAILQQQLTQIGSGQLGQFIHSRLLAQPTGPAPTSGSTIPAPPSSSTPAPTPTPAPGPVAASPSSTLIRDVASAYSTIPTIRADFERRINQDLLGLPDTLMVRVLEDWKADLHGGRPDPDPQTGAQTSVEQRILRQLQLTGTRIESLPVALQQRLRAAQTPQTGGPF